MYQWMSERGLTMHQLRNRAMRRFAALSWWWRGVLICVLLILAILAIWYLPVAVSVLPAKWYWPGVVFVATLVIVLAVVLWIGESICAAMSPKYCRRWKFEWGNPVPPNVLEVLQKRFGPASPQANTTPAGATATRYPGDQCNILRDMIRHENEVINHRMGWSLASQGALLSGFVLSADSSLLTGNSTCLLEISVGIVGIYGAICFYQHIRAAREAQDRLYDRWEYWQAANHRDNPGNHTFWPPVIGLSRREVDWENRYCRLCGFQHVAIAPILIWAVLISFAIVGLLGDRTFTGRDNSSQVKEIRAVDGKVDQLTKEMKTLTTSYFDIRKSHAALKESALSSNTTTTAEIQSLRAAVEQLQNQLAAFQVQRDSADAGQTEDIRLLRAAVEHLRTQLAAFQVHRDSADAGQTEDIRSLRAAVEHLRTQLAAFQVHRDSADAGQTEEIRSLHAAMEELRTPICCVPGPPRFG